MKNISLNTNLYSLSRESNAGESICAVIAQIGEVIKTIEKALAKHDCGSLALNDGLELVLHRFSRQPGSEVLWGYYIVDDKEKMLFWVEEYNAKWLFHNQFDGIADEAHKGERDCMCRFSRAY